MTINNMSFTSAVSADSGFSDGDDVVVGHSVIF